MDDIERSRPRLVVAIIALVVLALLAGGVYVLWADPGDRDSQAQGGTGGQPTASAPGTPGACEGVNPPSRTLPTKPPEDLDWAVENTALIPVSDRYGPAKRSGPVWTCFSHSPLGAVMAAAVISSRRVASFERITVGEQQLVDNPGKQVYLRAARAKAGQDLSAAPGTFAQPAGFRIDSYTGDTAVVSSATRSKDGALRAASLTVLWQDGDWRLQLMPDGGDSAALTRITTLQGYIPWGL